MGITREQIRAEISDLPTNVRVAAIGAVALDLVLKAAALADLSRRPASSLRGPKWFWALAQSVNGVGPVAYWLVGRR